ncbi:hypothetical protein BGZ97_011254, partial [Linnemannia gamsii]
IIRIKPLPRDGKGNNSKNKSGEQRSILNDSCSGEVDGGDVEDESDDDCEGNTGGDIDIPNNNGENSDER